MSYRSGATWTPEMFDICYELCVIQGQWRRRGRKSEWSVHRHKELTSLFCHLYREEQNKSPK